MHPKRIAKIIDRIRSTAEAAALVAINVAAWGTTWQVGVAATGATVLIASYAYGKRTHR